MIYNAVSIAKFIVSHCCQNGHPVSNLKLQAILYLAWIDYYNKTHRPLYVNNPYAWRTGPVIPDVYYMFCQFAGGPITKEYESCLTEADTPIMKHIVTTYMNTTTAALVNQTCRPGSPWSTVYRDGIGDRGIIPFPLIQRLECGET